MFISVSDIIILVMKMGTLFVVATPIGNLNDISRRTLDILNNCDFIAAEDTRNTIKILNHYGIKKSMTSYHKFNEKSKSSIIIKKLIEGSNVALVSDAGTPCISDPGYQLVKLARESKIDVIGIPGPSAVITALSISGLDTSNFSFYGFLPTDNKKLEIKLKEIQNSDINTFVIYESPKRLLKLLVKLNNYFNDSLLFVASDLTKIHERGFFGKVSDVLELLIKDSNVEKGEYVIVLQKSKKEINHKETNNCSSIEALLIDIIIKNKCSLKDAVQILKSNKEFKKNQIYAASLNLKKIFEK